jgi:hypothetical protein
MSPPQQEQRPQQESRSDRSRYQVRLPSFVLDRDIGLGDAITRVTQRLHIPSCGGCQRRADMLNRAVTFRRSQR